MELNANAIVGEVVKINYRTAEIFEKEGIDYCCGGNISIADACNNQGADSSKLLSNLQQVLDTDDADSKYISQLAIDLLADYVVQRHHSYVSEKSVFIQQKLAKLCEVHGNHHPELFEIKELFDGAVGNLTAHMKKEELILFPYIKRMIASQKQGSIEASALGNILDPINVMMAEHDVEGERFRKLRQLSNNYLTPDDGCGTYEVTNRALEDFEKDLHRHIHIENNILFPKALQLEAELLKTKGV